MLNYVCCGYISFCSAPELSLRMSSSGMGMASVFLSFSFDSQMSKPRLWLGSVDSFGVTKSFQVTVCAFPVLMSSIISVILDLVASSNEFEFEFEVLVWRTLKISVGSGGASELLE